MNGSMASAVMYIVIGVLFAIIVTASIWDALHPKDRSLITGAHFVAKWIADQEKWYIYRISDFLTTNNPKKVHSTSNRVDAMTVVNLRDNYHAESIEVANFNKLLNSGDNPKKG